MARRPDTTRNSEACDTFWGLVEPLMAVDGVEEGTMMQFPCLRSGGEFFAMPHHTSGELVLKLPAARVADLVATGVGTPFGPGDRVFKEWVLVGFEHRDSWLELMAEARRFVDPG